MQLTVPGHMNVEGAGLYGVPLVLVGHTANVAWSHTVSTAYRFTPMALKLSKTSPTTYLVDGTPHKMSTETVKVHTKTGTVTHTLYSSRYGPVFNNLQGQALDWTTDTAYSLFDANAGNTRLMNHFFRVDEAQSVPQLLKILRSDEGLPWVNTIAADRAGRALYADIGSIPYVTDKHANREVLVRAGVEQEGGRTWDLPAEQAAVPGPLRLRDQLQRQLLAVEPEPSADRVRADHRPGEVAALAAHPQWLGDDPGSPRRHRR